MAVNHSRSMNAELMEGMTDGSYKKLPPDRSVVPEGEEAWRKDMPWRYGMEQAYRMQTPDGRSVRA